MFVSNLRPIEQIKIPLYQNSWHFIQILYKSATSLDCLGQYNPTSASVCINLYHCLSKKGHRRVAIPL